MLKTSLLIAFAAANLVIVHTDATPQPNSSSSTFAPPTVPPPTTTAAPGICPELNVGYIPPFQGLLYSGGNASWFQWTISPTYPVSMTPPGSQPCGTFGYVSQYLPGGACVSVATTVAASPLPTATGCTYAFGGNLSVIVALSCDPFATSLVVDGVTAPTEALPSYTFQGRYRGVCPFATSTMPPLPNSSSSTFAPPTVPPSCNGTFINPYFNNLLSSSPTMNVKVLIFIYVGISVVLCAAVGVTVFIITRRLYSPTTSRVQVDGPSALGIDDSVQCKDLVLLGIPVSKSSERVKTKSLVDNV